MQPGALLYDGGTVWKLPKETIFFQTQPFNNSKNYAAETKAKPKIRLLCAIHRKKGASLDDIAEITNLSRATVHSILQRFQQKGIEGKDAIKQTGRPAFLTLEQRKNLIIHLKRGPPKNPSDLWTTKEAQEFIKQKYNLEYTNVHIWELLKAL